MIVLSVVTVATSLRTITPVPALIDASFVTEIVATPLSVTSPTAVSVRLSALMLITSTPLASLIVVDPPDVTVTVSIFVVMLIRSPAVALRSELEMTPPAMSSAALRITLSPKAVIVPAIMRPPAVAFVPSVISEILPSSPAMTLVAVMSPAAVMSMSPLTVLILVNVMLPKPCSRMLASAPLVLAVTLLLAASSRRPPLSMVVPPSGIPPISSTEVSVIVPLADRSAVPSSCRSLMAPLVPPSFVVDKEMLPLAETISSM